jgi:hypothetical protein
VNDAEKQESSPKETQRRFEMKRIFATLLMAAGITVPFVAHVAAQEHTGVADIPFAFVVSHNTLPAGHYKVSQSSMGSSVFLLADDQRHTSMVQLGTLVTGAPDKPSITFACYGKECVLAKVTPPGTPNAYALSQSGIEKSLSHKLGMAALVSVKVPVR